MPNNLKQFVQKFVQNRNKEHFPHLYIVGSPQLLLFLDKVTGPYRKIQDAIDAAEPSSLIKISEGFYEENLIIKYVLSIINSKPLTLQPKNKSTKEYESEDRIGVVLLASAGIAIHIKMSEYQQQCHISGMKISHSGNSDGLLKKELMEHQHILNIFQTHQNIEQPENQYVNRTSFGKVENIILLVERGLVKIQKCILSLNYLVKSCNSTIPAVWIEKEGTVSLLACEIKGHQTKPTIGIVCKLGVLNLQNSIVSSHSEGGLLIWGVLDNPSKIIKNLFQKNSFGIHVVGEEYKLKILNNRITENQIGIKVGLASQADISRNFISENVEGIEVISGFPTIYLNKIQKNSQNGIWLKTYKKLYCKAIIKKNVAIVGNKKNGILVEGQNNKTLITQNYLIAFNCESGIKVAKEAHPSISHNKIYKNYKEGILVVEKTNAIIQKNQISHNIQCNIALGGVNSHHTLLSENVISHSPGVGLNLIYSGRCKIVRNDIVNNFNGVFLLGSEAELRRNYIANNKNNGVVLQEGSAPRLIQNFLTRNCSVGLFLRHGSGKQNSIMHSNIVVSNQIDVGMQEKNSEVLKRLPFSNTVGSQIYYPESLECQLI